MCLATWKHGKTCYVRQWGGDSSASRCPCSWSSWWHGRRECPTGPRCWAPSVPNSGATRALETWAAWAKVKWCGRCSNWCKHELKHAQTCSNCLMSSKIVLVVCEGANPVGTGFWKPMNLCRRKYTSAKGWLVWTGWQNKRHITCVKLETCLVYECEKFGRRKYTKSQSLI